MTAQAGLTERASRNPGVSATYRPDIEGLRAVAIVTVLGYHAGLPVFTGGFVGVDVFFVVSGYLITSLILREIDRSGGLSLRRFYLRRARRLLPATAVVLMFSALVVALWTPATQGRIFGGDIIAATFYAINWRLADRSVDYLAEGVGASPVQHFWSLAVEEQFYVVWPLIIVASLALLRARVRREVGDRRPPAPGAVRRLLGILIGVVGLASLLWCFHASMKADPTAYFATTTRLWELAIGASVAVLAPYCPRLSARMAASLGWTGLFAISASAVVFSASTPWPGPATLAPTLGAAAVIVSGLGGSRPASSRALSVRGAVWLGGLSYSIYLWHWPVLVAAEGWLGRPLSPLEGVAAVVVSVVPAWVTHKLVENPIRFSPYFAGPKVAIQVAVASVVTGLVAGVLATSPWVRTPDSAPTGSTPRGAEVIVARPSSAWELWKIDEFEWITPLPAEATADVPDSYAEGCQVDALAEDAVTCEYGDTTSETVVLLAGDSKALQWQPALDALAVENSWRLVTMTKSGCALSGGVQPFNDAEPYSSCVRWNSAALEQLDALSPDVVITSQYANSAYEDESSPIGSATAGRMQDDLAALWTGLTARGIHVIALLDTPTPPFEVYECVAERPNNLSACAFDPVLPDRENASVVQRAAAADVPGVEVVDMTPYICPGDRCPAVMGNVLTYRQGSHLTKTFVETLVSPLRGALVPLVSGVAAG